jgi:hypothetical protein
VAKKQKLDKQWNANRLKAQPFCNSALAQIEVALNEMGQLMQIVTGVRLEDLAAKAKSRSESRYSAQMRSHARRMGALMDLGQSFCQSTAMICNLPPSEVFSQVCGLD